MLASVAGPGDFLHGSKTPTALIEPLHGQSLKVRDLKVIRNLCNIAAHQGIRTWEMTKSKMSELTQGYFWKGTGSPASLRVNADVSLWPLTSTLIPRTAWNLQMYRVKYLSVQE